MVAPKNDRRCWEPCVLSSVCLSCALNYCVFHCLNFYMLFTAFLSHQAPFWLTPPFNFVFKFVQFVVKVQIEKSIGGNCEHNLRFTTVTHLSTGLLQNPLPVHANLIFLTIIQCASNIFIWLMAETGDKAELSIPMVVDAGSGCHIKIKHHSN